MDFKKNTRPIYLQIADNICDAILSGTHALWSRPGVGGTEVVTRLTDPADETEVELEMLFKYMSTRPANNPFL